MNLVKKSLKRLQGVIRIRKSKDRQHNGQKKKDKRTNNDLHNITHKTKDRVTRTPIKTGGELRCSEKVDSSCATSGIRRVTLTSGDLGHDHPNPRCNSGSTT